MGAALKIQNKYKRFWNSFISYTNAFYENSECQHNIIYCNLSCYCCWSEIPFERADQNFWVMPSKSVRKRFIGQKYNRMVLNLPLSELWEISNLNAWQTINRKSGLSVRATPNIRATDLNAC